MDLANCIRSVCEFLIKLLDAMRNVMRNRIFIQCVCYYLKYYFSENDNKGKTERVHDMLGITEQEFNGYGYNICCFDRDVV